MLVSPHFHHEQADLRMHPGRQNFRGAVIRTEYTIRGDDCRTMYVLRRFRSRPVSQTKSALTETLSDG